MTSSLVGSEMCIRDSPRRASSSRHSYPQEFESMDVLRSQVGEAITRTVSYTHLTLPTICSV
eukprot:7125827-Prorocentrum_lima.AAC.1